MRGFGFAIAAIGVLAAASLAAAAEKPRLVVAVSIDQFPQEYLSRFRHGFAEDGFFLRLEREGARFINCHHAHALTKTGPGHSVMMTGTFPGATGIIDNDWFDRRTGKTIYCVSDPEAEIVGAPAGVEERMSPRNLQVGTMGDVLKLATSGKAKVFGVAIKDRGGILMSGHNTDCCFWFDPDHGKWVTSKYYRDDLPGYVRLFNEDGSVTRYAGQTWDLLLPRDQYVEIVPDDNEFEQNVPVLGRAFPHPLPAEPDSTYFKVMPVSPFGNAMTLDLARLIVEYEKLGADDVPDVLCISLSSNDYVGHAFGPHSLEVQDMTFRTDRLLGAFVNWLDEHVGKGKWVLALSSDHGVAPVPEIAQKLGLPARRGPLGSLDALADRLETALVKHLGSPSGKKKYVQRVEANMVYLNRDLPELSGQKFNEAQDIVRDLLLDDPYVAAAYSRHELQGAESTPLGAKFQRSFNPRLSGDVLFALQPYCLPSGRTPATHGSPWSYDTHVPLAFLGAGIRPGMYPERTSPAAMGPTLAMLLGIDNPPGAVVEPLAEALK